MFVRAERKRAKLRLGLSGPSGSGKTYSALELAFGLGGKIAMIDTEHKSGELYSHLGDYDIATLRPPFTPDRYITLIREAEKAKYDTIIIDSLTHAWAGEGGILDMQGRIADSGKANSYTAWRFVTPKHNALVEAILQSPCHIIATLRAKTEYSINENNGRKDITKVGLAPIQRDGMEYEFTVFMDISIDHSAHASKDRTTLFKDRYFTISKEIGIELNDWLLAGKEETKELIIHEAQLLDAEQAQQKKVVNLR